MKKIISLVMVVCFFCLTGCYVHGRSGYYGGGEYFWGGMAAGAVTGAILAPLIYPPNYFPSARGEEYYVRDYYGHHRIWTPPPRCR
jgi:hypothetical protein